MASKKIMAEAMSIPHRGIKSKAILYQEASKHSPRAIEVLVELMDKADNDSVRISAAKTILAKAIPDLHDVELGNKDGQPFQFGYIKDFISTGGWHVPASIGGTEGPNALQSNSLAPKSEENYNSLGKGESGSTQRPEQNILGSISNKNSS